MTTSEPEYWTLASSSAVMNILVGLIEDIVSKEAFNLFENMPDELSIFPIFFVITSVTIQTT